MKKAAEYHKLAEECRAMARTIGNEEQRQQLLNMAETWDKLAETREGLVARHPELDSSSWSGSRNGSGQADANGPRAPLSRSAD
jgi:hypothetical protein